jgi:hypothetical protein
MTAFASLTFPRTLGPSTAPSSSLSRTLVGRFAVGCSSGASGIFCSTINKSLFVSEHCEIYVLNFPRISDRQVPTSIPQLVKSTHEAASLSRHWFIKSIWPRALK